MAGSHPHHHNLPLSIKAELDSAIAKLRGSSWGNALTNKKRDEVYQFFAYVIYETRAKIVNDLFKK